MALRELLKAREITRLLTLENDVDSRNWRSEKLLTLQSAVRYDAGQARRQTGGRAEL